MRDPIQPVHRRRPSWVVPTAIIVGVVAAIALGAVIGLVLTGARSVAQDDPNPTPSASTHASVSAIPTAEPSTAPTPTPDPTPIALPIIPNGAIAAITVDALPVWSDPDEDTNEYGELGDGARLFIIGEPTELDGQRWYRIAYVDGPRVSGFDLGPCQLNRHFEDPAAPTCRLDDTRVADGPSTAEIVLRCRTAFVVTDVEVFPAP